MVISRNRAKATLLAGVACSLAIAAPAFAQEADDAAPQGEEDAGIIVSGIRSSLQSSAAQKRDAIQVIDAVTAEDIGKFPTENVADAAQRITGVQITRTRGSGSGASIRGLPADFTLVQLNGSSLSSAITDLRGGGAGGTISRGFDFRLLPTEFVSTLEVIKSPTADLDEGGLSGTINVKTVRPLDLGKTTLVGSGFAVYNSNSGKTTPRFSGLASGVFADGRLGILISGGYDRNKTETHSVNNVGWGTQTESVSGIDYNADGDLGDRFNIPVQVRTEIAREDRERIALASIVEFEATDNLKLYAEGFYSRFDIYVDSLENLHIFTGTRATGVAYDPGTTVIADIPGIDPTQPTSGVPFITRLGLTEVDVRGNDRVNDSLAQTYYFKGGAEYESDRLDARATFVYSRAKQTGDNLNLAQIQRFALAYDCQPGDDICGLDLRPETAARYLDPAQGIVASLNGAFDRLQTDEIFEAKADLTWKFDASILRAINFGAKASWRDTFANGSFLIVPGAVLRGLVGLQPTTVQPSGLSVIPYTQVVSPGNGAFLGAYSGSRPFPEQYLATDTPALLADLSREQLLTNGIFVANENANVDVGEDILAGYVRADFASDDDRISGNVGLRVVRTKSASVGVGVDFNTIVSNVDAGGNVTVAPLAGFTETNTYTEFLPSANIRLELTDSLIARFGASRTMSRPSLTQISPSTTLAGGSGNFSLTSGNPQLDPFVSLNFDASLEWYPNADTALTLAVFSKDLSTLVRPESDNVTLPVTFVSTATNTSELRNTLFTRTRPTNQEGVTLKGFEIGAQQVFTFLPGVLKNVGVQANYTYISNSDPQVLTAASKHNFNLSAFYEDDFLGLRASYTYRDKFVSVGLPDGFNGLGLTTQARGNLDLNVTFNIIDQVTIVLEGTNVLENTDKTRTTLGNLPADYFDTGRQLLAGVRFRY